MDCWIVGVEKLTQNHSATWKICGEAARWSNRSIYRSHKSNHASFQKVSLTWAERCCKFFGGKSKTLTCAVMTNLINYSRSWGGSEDKSPSSDQARFLFCWGILIRVLNQGHWYQQRDSECCSVPRDHWPAICAHGLASQQTCPSRGSRSPEHMAIDRWPRYRTKAGIESTCRYV